MFQFRRADAPEQPGIRIAWCFVGIDAVGQLVARHQLHPAERFFVFGIGFPIESFVPGSWS